MFIELLTTCRARSYGESLASNSELRIKFVSLNNQCLLYLLSVLINLMAVLVLLMINILKHVLQIKQKKIEFNST